MSINQASSSNQTDISPSEISASSAIKVLFKFIASLSFGSTSVTSNLKSSWSSINTLTSPDLPPVTCEEGLKKAMLGTAYREMLLHLKKTPSFMSVSLVICYTKFWFNRCLFYFYLLFLLLAFFASISFFISSRFFVLCECDEVFFFGLKAIILFGMS